MSCKLLGLVENTDEYIAVVLNDDALIGIVECDEET